MANNSINRPPWNASTRVLSYRSWYSPPLSSIPSLPGKPKDFSHVLPKVNCNNRQIPKRPHMEKGGPLIPASSTLPDIDASASNYESEFITLAPAVPLIHPIDQCTADSENISEPEIATESVNLASAVPLITVDQCTADSETVSEPVIATESITLSPAVPLIMTNQCTADSETKTEPQMMESNSVPLLSHIGAHPLPSPTGRRGGVVAPTIASTAKQRAKFQARCVEKGRWNMNQKQKIGASNNNLPGNFTDLYSHIGPRVSTFWEPSTTIYLEEEDIIVPSPPSDPVPARDSFWELLEIHKKTEAYTEAKYTRIISSLEDKNKELLCKVTTLTEKLAIYWEEWSEMLKKNTELQDEIRKRRKPTSIVTLQNGAVVSLPPEYSACTSIRLECSYITFISDGEAGDNCTTILPARFVPNEKSNDVDIDEG